MMYLAGLLLGGALLVNWAAANVNHGHGWTDRLCASDAGLLCQNPKTVLVAAVGVLLVALCRSIARSNS